MGRKRSEDAPRHPLSLCLTTQRVKCERVLMLEVWIALGALTVGVGVLAAAQYRSSTAAWPRQALRGISDLRAEFDALERTWATTKLHLVDQLEAVEDVCSRIEKKRRQIAASESKPEPEKDAPAAAEEESETEALEVERTPLEQAREDLRARKTARGR